MYNIERIIDSMSLDELCGQVLVYYIDNKWTEKSLNDIAQKTKPGGFFISKTECSDMILRYSQIINEHTKVPVIVCADMEYGPGCTFEGETIMPHPMAWGACNNKELVYNAGVVTAEIARSYGVHWNFAPVVDINYNKDNPVVNIRAISDCPERVVEIGGAYLSGLQKNRHMVACCKHFPGDGIDDRNQHFCTTVNSMSQSEWMETYGYVYRKMFEKGASSVMVAHIALPVFQDDAEYDEVLGYLPASLSSSLINGLLKGKLGFEGCVVSDAISMIGVSAMVSPDELVVKFLNAGGDMALFAQPEDFVRVKKAVLSGKLPIERLKDAVRRILKMKQEAGLFEEYLMPDLTYCRDLIKKISDEIGEKCIKIVRNAQNLIPINLKPNSKILICNIHRVPPEKELPLKNLDVLEKALKERGYDVDVLVNAGHYEVQAIKDKYDCILINSTLSGNDCSGGSLRAGWEHVFLFWRGYVLEHPCVIFTSFGDPYKLHDFPFLKTYLNAHSFSESVQRGLVRLLLGETEGCSTSPVCLEDFSQKKSGSNYLEENI